MNLKKRNLNINLNGKTVELKLNDGEFVALAVDDPMMDVNDINYILRDAFKSKDAFIKWLDETPNSYSSKANLVPCIFKVNHHLLEDEYDIYENCSFVSTVEDRVAITNDKSILTTGNYVNRTFGEHTGYISHTPALEPIKDGKKFMVCKEYVGNHNPFDKWDDNVTAINEKIKGFCDEYVDEDSHGCKELDEISKEQVNRLYEDGHAPAVINFYYDTRRYCNRYEADNRSNEDRAVYREVYACKVEDGKVKYELVLAYWAY